MGLSPRMLTARPAALALGAVIVLTAVAPAIPAAAPGPVTVDASERRIQLSGTRDFTLPTGTTHLALHWRGHRNAVVTAAFSFDGVTFGEPTHVELDEPGNPGLDRLGQPTDESFGPVISVAGAQAVRVTADRQLEITVLTMNARNEVRVEELAGGTVRGSNPVPPVISRAGWGADETLRFDELGETRWWHAFYPLQKLVVHHTAGANNDPNPAATVRAIYYYHAVTKGWGDIGYNYLIDEAGRVYEGRHSRNYWWGAVPTADEGTGLIVEAGGQRSYNPGTLPISLMGNFTDRAPTAAARAALERMLVWAASTHGLDPLGTSTYVNPVTGATITTPNITGHRDYQSTACPGTYLNALLPAIRTSVAAQLNAWPSEVYSPPRWLTFAPGTYVGRTFSPSGTITGSKTSTLSVTSGAPTGQASTIPNQAGTWYYVTAGIWAGYWIAQAPGITLGPQPAAVDADSYQPWLPLHVAAGSYTGYRFNSYGSVTASRSVTVAADTWFTTTERSDVPNRSGSWFYVTNGPLDGYWVAASTSVTLGQLPTVRFSASQVTGLEPLTVSFRNTSITYGPVSIGWDFDADGTTDSTEPNPVHTYSAGTYSVRLTVIDAMGNDSVTMTDLVTVRASQPGTYVALNPTRLLDTRSGNGLSGDFGVNQPRSFQVSGRGGVPAEAIAITGNLTVTNQTAPGYVYLGPDPVTSPTSSTLNFPVGDSRANGVTVALGPDGTLSATYVARSGATTDLVFDVTGYFVMSGP